MLNAFDPKVLNLNPLVATIYGFMSRSECDGLIAAAEGRMTRATVTDGAKGKVSENRTNSHCPLGMQDTPLVAQMLMKIGIVLRMPIDRAEGPMILHYACAEEFKPHSDGIDLAVSAEQIAGFERNGGQRLFSTMLYLNEVEAGGGTGFPELGLSVAPVPGRLLIFANTLAGSRDMTNLAIHAGEPVEAGEKWAAITWWRERARAS